MRSPGTVERDLLVVGLPPTAMTASHVPISRRPRIARKHAAASVRTFYTVGMRGDVRRNFCPSAGRVGLVVFFPPFRATHDAGIWVAPQASGVNDAMKGRARCSARLASSRASRSRRPTVTSASWTVRYLVVDTGTWLPGRKVLISPFAFEAVLDASRLKTMLSKDQIENSPSIDTDRPVNRQREIEYSLYYGALGAGRWVASGSVQVFSGSPPREYCPCDRYGLGALDRAPLSGKRPVRPPRRLSADSRRYVTKPRRLSGSQRVDGAPFVTAPEGVRALSLVLRCHTKSVRFTRSVSRGSTQKGFSRVLVFMGCD